MLNRKTLLSVLLFSCSSNPPAPDETLAQAPGGSPPDSPATPADAGPRAEDAALPPPPPLPPATPIAGVARVWGLHDGDKIDQDDLKSPLAPKNFAWDGSRVKVFAARNEIVAFQLVVESDAKGVKQMSVALPELRQRGGTATIRYAPPDADPTHYEGRPIQIFSEHYMHVTDPTNANWVFSSGSAAAPANPTGWKPVQLVPENAKSGRGGLPIDVEPSKNQAFWIDVYTGKGLPAGIYDGAVRLRAGDSFRDIPVELELFDFELPDENSMSAMLYFEPEQLDLYQRGGIEDRFHRFAHRNRVELVYAYDAPSVQASMDRFDGSAFTAAAGYDGPGVSVGNRIVPASFYGPGSDYDDRASAVATSDAWMSFLAGAVPRATTFLYMPDEPSSAEYPRIRTISGNVKSSSGPGKGLPIFATTSWSSALDGAIDIWCSGPKRFDVQRAAAERQKGHKYWFYNGGRPASGAVIIDAPATDVRVSAWAAFKHEVDVYFYWHADHWRHNQQKSGERNQNVWLNPITFDNRSGSGDSGYINGDGVLMYPGTEKLHPQEDRGIDGPVSTIQLANLRRGLEDHQYLTLARRRGLEPAVAHAIATVVPKVFSEAGSTVAFAEHGDAYEAERYALARALVGK